MTKRKGIILAGGSGTRLHPMTLAVSKQLLNIYDKPMIYYPLSTLMMSDIRDICIITSPNNSKLFKDLLGDGSNYGIDLTYIEQPSPDGLAQAYLLAENFLNGSPSAMILGDNIFYGSDFEKLIKLASKNQNESTIFGYRVRDPRRYGVVDIDDKGKAINDVIPKIMKIHIKHKKNLIRIIANRNVDQKQIVDHLTILPIDRSI